MSVKEKLFTISKMYPSWNLNALSVKNTVKYLQKKCLLGVKNKFWYQVDEKTFSDSPFCFPSDTVII